MAAVSKNTPPNYN